MQQINEKVTAENWNTFSNEDKYRIVRKNFSNALLRRIGMGLDDLPDTPEIQITNWWDEGMSFEETIKAIKNAADEVGESLGSEGIGSRYFESTLDEKAKSKAQQKFFGMVHQCKKTGKCASKEVAKTAKSISATEAEKFAKTKHEGLPEKKKAKKVMKEAYRKDKYSNEKDRGERRSLRKMKKVYNRKERRLAKQQALRDVEEEGTMNKQKKVIVEFIDSICNKNYSESKKKLSNIIEEKIKERIRQSVKA